MSECEETAEEPFRAWFGLVGELRSLYSIMASSPKRCLYSSGISLNWSLRKTFRTLLSFSSRLDSSSISLVVSDPGVAAIATNLTYSSALPLELCAVIHDKGFAMLLFPD